MANQINLLTTAVWLSNQQVFSCFLFFFKMPWSFMMMSIITFHRFLFFTIFELLHILWKYSVVTFYVWLESLTFVVNFLYCCLLSLTQDHNYGTPCNYQIHNMVVMIKQTSLPRSPTVPPEALQSPPHWFENVKLKIQIFIVLWSTFSTKMTEIVIIHTCLSV